jgi:hypothetical protein
LHERTSDGIRRRQIPNEGNDFMTPENTDTPLMADCPSAPCSAIFCDCCDSNIRKVDKSRPHPAIDREGWFCMGCLSEFDRISETQRMDSVFMYKTLKRVIDERDNAIELSKQLAAYGDPKPWRIQEWQEAKSKISLPNA